MCSVSHKTFTKRKTKQTCWTCSRNWYETRVFVQEVERFEGLETSQRSHRRNIMRQRSSRSVDLGSGSFLQLYHIHYRNKIFTPRISSLSDVPNDLRCSNRHYQNLDQLRRRSQLSSDIEDVVMTSGNLWRSMIHLHSIDTFRLRRSANRQHCFQSPILLEKGSRLRETEKILLTLICSWKIGVIHFGTLIFQTLDLCHRVLTLG